MHRADSVCFHFQVRDFPFKPILSRVRGDGYLIIVCEAEVFLWLGPDQTGTVRSNRRAFIELEGEESFFTESRGDAVRLLVCRVLGLRAGQSVALADGPDEIPAAQMQRITRACAAVCDEDRIALRRVDLAGKRERRIGDVRCFP